ncbi:thiolase family protein [Dactylosporangium sucinum]|uniref:Probable acetyl-CoA acetyltransferase n=1 Tax=Dactylosporangium sucinum TaxID=1424081 RepID=A0A917U182_9ACTN|nr:thiolase family protein [Dactylosporangium sucinum]GGM45498.1 acetyl-CoA acetyltransferase [Dactylosporangium sucinum]
MTGDVVVLATGRTPFGRFGGALRDLPLPELGAIPVGAVLHRAGLTGADVDELAFGVNFPGSERSVARQVLLRAGIPEEKVAYTVDRACCSSLAAITLASRGLRLDDTALSVAGAVENLSRVPYFVHEARFGNRIGDIVLTDQLVVSCPHTGVPRAVQAGAEATEYGVDRAEQDDWALRSQQRYADALARGCFDDEIVPVDVPDRNGRAVRLAADEVPRPATTAQQLAALPTVYGSATVTAGNAPNMSTGAVALVLASEGEATRRGTTGLATVGACTQVSGDPQRLASMPARAAQRALARAGLTLADIDLIEVNEAFAAVPLVTTLVLADGDRDKARRLRERTNVNGGAVAVGHPTGATGGRLVMTVINELRRRGGGRGLVTICGGVGEAESVIVTVR